MGNEANDTDGADRSGKHARTHAYSDAIALDEKRHLRTARFERSDGLFVLHLTEVLSIDFHDFIA